MLNVKMSSNVYLGAVSSRALSLVETSLVSNRADFDSLKPTVGAVKCDGDCRASPFDVDGFSFEFDTIAAAVAIAGFILFCFGGRNIKTSPIK